MSTTDDRDDREGNSMQVDLQVGSRRARAAVRDGCVNAQDLKPLGVMAYDPGTFCVCVMLLWSGAAAA